MAVRAQASTSSLTKYATAKSPGVDLYNGSTSRDFCNSFWGGGDAGVNVLFARMRGAARTTDNLRNFWKERSTIEEEYASKLLHLAQSTMGKDEIGELRNALDTLQLETEKLAKTHLQLSSQIRTEMEDPTTALLNKQLEHRRSTQSPVEKKFKSKLSQESYVTKAREKYQSDCFRIATYSQQLDNQSPDAERIRVKLKRAEQTVGANEKDYAAFAKTLSDMIPGWEEDWKNFCDSCQDLEEERLDFMKDNLWAYANAVSTICVADDESCETIRTVLDQLETDRDIEAFVQEYGTGNSIPNPPDFVPYSGSTNANGSTPSLVGSVTATAVSTRPANYARKSRKPFPAYTPAASANAAAALRRDPSVTSSGQNHRTPSPTRAPTNNNAFPPRGANNVPPPPPTSPPQIHQSPPQARNGNGPNGYSEPDPKRTAALTDRRMTLPPQPAGIEVAAPIPPAAPTGDERNKILFYGTLEAMYDYTATIDEEFNFQAGDIIAVTDIPDDGWWSGELLDEARREEGRHVFPSNFVRLF
ncbi:hypothetical protein BDP27DRAFT_1212478 [Rhodocollybia butyracea]|uniref:SH3 domain-containing protein n=1 Tax=Rhodocollybia butyracea TaxID=206335 RepID=A0A9P5Q657_9AGAR|nr:hypothetical protein BDP27DRAFT_1212478 [Rhodocollybia butyracea]